MPYGEGKMAGKHLQRREQLLCKQSATGIGGNGHHLAARIRGCAGAACFDAEFPEWSRLGRRNETRRELARFGVLQRRIVCKRIPRIVHF